MLFKGRVDCLHGRARKNYKPHIKILKMASTRTTLEKGFSLISKLLLKDCLKNVETTRSDLFGSLDDEARKAEARAACKRALGESIRKAPAKKWERLVEMASSLLTRVQAMPMSDDLRNVALGVEAFNWAPADLPEGSTLHPEQIDAAAALTQRYVLQMDTGEGKTYALLPAAFALACKHERVYILCANKYLARRDATRTRPFWDFAGLDVGLALDNLSPEEWAHPVIYTTLETLMFQALRDEIAPVASKNPVQYGAIVLDDADATLLDNATMPFSLAEDRDEKPFDWEPAFGLADTLEAGVHIEVNQRSRYASLTIEGEKFLERAIGKKDDEQEKEYLILRRAVENAYLAKYVLKEGKDYETRLFQVIPMNLISGQLQPGASYDWVPAVSFLKNSFFYSRIQKGSVTLHQTTPALLLNDFAHVSGLSGTTVGDELEYFLTYRLWTAVIPPHRQRHEDGMLEDLVLKDRKSAIKYLCGETLKARQKERPVFIGTQTVDDATAVAKALQDMPFPDGTIFRVLTGKNEEDMDSLLEGAGEPGSVLVATQIGGRGVDIRLSEKAWENGGLALLGLGHATELRHDRQFLGRAGRHAAPFTARFINSKDDDLIRRAITKGSIADNLVALKDDEALEHSWLTGRIRYLQTKTRQVEQIRRFNLSIIRPVEAQIRHSYKEWMAYIQTLNTQSDGMEMFYDCSDEFLNYIITRSLKTLLAPDMEKGALKAKRAEAVVETLVRELGLKTIKTKLKSSEIEGRPTNLALEELRKQLMKCLKVEIARNEQHHAWQKDERKPLADLMAEYERKMALQNDIENMLNERAESTWAAVRSTLRPPAAPETDEQREAEKPDPLDEKIEELSAHLLEHPHARVETALEKIEEFLNEHGLGKQYALAACDRRLVVVRRDEQARADNADGPLAAPAHDSASGAAQGNPSANEAALAALNEKLKTSCGPGDTDVAALKAPDFLKTLDEETCLIAASISDLERNESHRKETFKYTPRAVALWTFRQKWSVFLEEYEKIKHRAAQETSGLLYARVVIDQIARRWMETESRLAIDILRNLFLVGENKRLDRLYAENTRVSPQHADMQRWHEIRSQLDDKDAGTWFLNWQGSLIWQFMEKARLGLEKADISLEQARQVLRKFVKDAPISALQTPEKADEVMQKKPWLDKPGTADGNANAKKQCAQMFLNFLRARRLIAKKPSFTERCLARVAPVLGKLRDRSWFLSLPLAGILIGTFILAINFGYRAPSHVMAGIGKLADDLFCAGLLGAGNIIAPAMVSLIFGMAVTRWFVPNMQPNARGAGFDRLVVPLAQIVLAACMAWPREGGGVGGALSSLGLFFMIMAACWIIQRASWTFTRHSDISLEAAWLCITIPLVFMPGLAASAPIGGKWPAVFALLAALLLTWKFYNKKELSFVSLLVADSHNLNSGILMRHTKKFFGDTGIRGQMIAIFIAWCACEIYNMQGFIPAVAIDGLTGAGIAALAAYLLALVLWINWVLKKHLSPLGVQQWINQNHLWLDGATTLDDCLACYSATRKALVRREIAFHVVLAALAASCAQYFGFMKNGFPSVLFFLSVTFLFAYCARDVATSAYRYFLARQRMAQNIMDFGGADRQEDDEEAGFLSRHKKLLRIIYLGYGTICGLFTFWQIFKELFR